MIDLTKLAVSLTKHGAHKLSTLLKNIDASEILSNTTGSIEGVNIDAGQVRKLLSADKKHNVPQVWFELQTENAFMIQSMVMLAILFSHHAMIEEMIASSGGAGQGLIRRVQFPGSKIFTNLRNDFEELGFATFRERDEFGYDLRPVLLNDSFRPYAKELFRLKLKDAKWKGGDVVKGSVEAGFHTALGLDKKAFARWLDGTLTLEDKTQVGVPDANEEKKRPFVFKHGHKPKKTGKIKLTERTTERFASLLHNEIQNLIYIWMTNAYGEANVSAENLTGLGDTCIDLVRKEGTGHVFYEIKTAASLKTCIRDALPQLLEYAYWPTETRSHQLIIVSRNAPTKDAKSYLARLRDEFGIPVFHETVDILTGALSDRI